MTEGDWQTGYARSLAVFLNGDAITEPGPRGESLRDQSFLLLFNANREPVTFTVPGPRFGAAWDVLIDTAAPAPRPATEPPVTLPSGQRVAVDGRSLMVLRGTEGDGPGAQGRRQAGTGGGAV
jgi:isoamylase